MSYMLPNHKRYRKKRYKPKRISSTTTKQSISPKRILCNDQFYGRTFKWQLDSDKLRTFLQNKTTKSKNHSLSGHFAVNGIEFQCVLVNEGELTSNAVTTSFQIKVILPPYAEALRCYIKMQLNNSKIAFSKTATRGRDTSDNSPRPRSQKQYYLCNYHTNWDAFFEFSQLAQSTYINSYFAAINAGYKCFWCIPSNNTRPTQYVAFLLAQISRNEPLLVEALQIARSTALTYGERNIDWTEIREWIVEPLKSQHPLAKNGRWKTKGYLIDCRNKNIAEKIYKQLKHFMSKKFLHHHTTLTCRLVLDEFGAAFMEQQLYATHSHSKSRVAAKLKHKPQGPKYMYKAFESRHPSIEGMAAHPEAVSHNEWSFQHFDASTFKGGSVRNVTTINCTVEVLEIAQKSPLPIITPSIITMKRSFRYEWAIDAELFFAFKKLTKNEEFCSPNFGNGNWTLTIVQKRNWASTVPLGWVLTLRLLKLPSKVRQVMTKFIVKGNVYNTEYEFRAFSYKDMEFKSKMEAEIENVDALKLSVDLEILNVFDFSGCVKRYDWSKYGIIG